MTGGESHEVADAAEKWARGAPSLTALRPTDTPEGDVGFLNARAPDGEWGPREYSDADALLFREAESPRSRQIARGGPYCFHGRIEYGMRAHRKGGEKDQSPGAILRKCRMGRGGGRRLGRRVLPGGRLFSPRNPHRPARAREAS